MLACEDRTPLGLRNGLIRDDQISASSIFQNEPDLLPYFARLDNPYRWCSGPNEAVEKEYLQVCYVVMLLLLSARYFSMGKIERGFNCKIWGFCCPIAEVIDCHLIIRHELDGLTFETKLGITFSG